MKKALYLLCMCALSMLIFSEFQRNNGKMEQSEDDVAVQSTFSEGAGGENDTKDSGSAQGVRNHEKTAYLTFDDGPSEVTPQVLDTLKKKHARATFFLVGSEITPEREEIVKRELSEGHQVGIHTFSHKKNEMYCDEKNFFEDFNLCRDRIKEVTGVSPTLHRFPWGSNNGYVCPIVDDIIEKLQKQKITSFDWNVSGEDSISQNVPKATIYHNVAKDLERYDEPIILLHDSNTMKNTSEVLGEILDLIVEKGYSFGTLDEREGYTFPESWR